MRARVFHSPRAVEIIRIIRSIADLDNTMRLTTEARNAMLTVVPLPIVHKIFGNVDQVGHANFQFMDALMQTQSLDRQFERPIGQLLLQVCECCEARREYKRVSFFASSCFCAF